MKKLFYLSIILISSLVSAQTTPQALQGTWKIEAIEMSGIYFELSTGKIVLDESLASQGEATPAEMAIMAETLKGQLADHYSNFIKFDNNNLMLSFAGKSKEGTYSIKEKDGHEYLEIIYPAGTVKEIEFTVKGGLLSLTSMGGEMIYKLTPDNIITSKS